MFVTILVFVLTPHPAPLLGYVFINGLSSGVTNNDFMSTIKCNVKGGSYTVEVGQSKDMLVVHDRNIL